MADIYGVFRLGGSIGTKINTYIDGRAATLVNTFPTIEEAKDFAKGRRSMVVLEL